MAGLSATTALNLSATTLLALGQTDPQVTAATLAGLFNLTLEPTMTHVDDDLTSTWSTLSAPPPSTMASSTVRPTKGRGGGHPMVRTQQVQSRSRSPPSSASSMRASVDAWSVPPQDMIPDQAWLAFQVVHTMLTIMALAVNCTSLGVIYGVVVRLTPPLQLLTSLAFADMLAPWAIMTMYFPSSACQDEIHTALLITSHNAAALTLLALAFVHNIATFRPLNYDRIVTQRRLWITINVIWICAIVAAHVHFLAVLTQHDPRLPFCIQVLHNTKLALTLSASLLAATVVVSALLYARILLHLRPVGIFAAASAGADDRVAPRKSTRGVVTGVILATVFTLTWLPYLVLKFVNVRDGYIRHPGVLVGLNVCQVLVLLANVADPLVYGLRMSAMQSGYLTLYHKVRGGCILTWRRCTSRARSDEMPSTPLNPIESIC